MKIVGKGLLVGLTILCALSVSAATELAPISGFYYQDEISRPLPGALIALYKTDDNTLIDFTYTRNDGAFALKAPALKGKYYVVATKDQFTQKKDFDYDPAAAIPINLMIQHHQPKSTFKKFQDWVGTRFDDVIKVLIGLLVGLLFKIWDDRRKARQIIIRDLKSIKDSSDDIFSNYQELQQIREVYGQSSGNAASTQREKFVSLAATIGHQVEELQKQLDDKSGLEEAIYTAHKLKGRDSYAALRQSLRGIRKLTETIAANPASILDATQADRDGQLKPFERLRTNNLFRNY
jgi:hypothetical protein